MPEIDNNQAADEGADKQTNAGEGHNATNDVKENGSNANAGQGGDGVSEEGDKTASGKKEGEKAKAPNGKETEVIDDGSEPESRKRLSKQDFFIGRQRAKLAKKEAKADGAGGEGGGEGEGADEEEDEDVTPQDEVIINKVVAKNFAPLIEKTLAAEDEQEVQAFLKENPDFKEFEAKARRYMAHPSRRNLPIKSIFYEVAGDKLIRIGAERERAANLKAKETQTGGGSNRAGEGAKNDWELSKEEFAKKQERVRQGK